MICLICFLLFKNIDYCCCLVVSIIIDYHFLLLSDVFFFFFFICYINGCKCLWWLLHDVSVWNLNQIRLSLIIFSLLLFSCLEWYILEKQTKKTIHNNHINFFFVFIMVININLQLSIHHWFLFGQFKYPLFFLIHINYIHNTRTRKSRNFCRFFHDKNKCVNIESLNVKNWIYFFCCCFLNIFSYSQLYTFDV